MDKSYNIGFSVQSDIMLVRHSKKNNRTVKIAKQAKDVHEDGVYKKYI
jgi:hypothetical protein